MDNSLLYFIFPRLRESRRVLSRNIVFGDVNRILHIDLNKPLALKRHSQQLRMVIVEDYEVNVRRRFVYEHTDDFVSIVGLTEDAEGNAIRYPFRWVESGGGCINFRANSKMPFSRIEIECAAPGIYDLVWVCFDPAPK
jgi:hypothetical protein